MYPDFMLLGFDRTGGTYYPVFVTSRDTVGIYCRRREHADQATAQTSKVDKSEYRIVGVADADYEGK